ncbi:hypothetical protein Tco_0002840 [Tanacetum coccineum]
MSEARMREVIREQVAISMAEFMANMNHGPVVMKPVVVEPVVVEPVVLEPYALFLVKLAMSPFLPKKFRMGVAIVIGRRRERGGEISGETVTKNGVVTRYPGKFHEYQLTDKEKEFERMVIYWEQVEYEVSDDDDSALKSTGRGVAKRLMKAGYTVLVVMKV